MKNRELLYELLKTPSPSGYELNIQKNLKLAKNLLYGTMASEVFT